MNAQPDQSDTAQPKAVTPSAWTWRRKAAVVLSSIVIVIGGLGWLWYVDRFPSWEEEVMLSDGRMIMVNRKQEYIEGYGVKRTWLTFSLPEMGGEQTWYEWMYPAIVDVYEGKVYVVGYTPGVNQFSEYLYPRYQLVSYLFDGKKFARIRFNQLPDQIKKSYNIIYCSARGEHTSLVDKRKGWCDETGQYRLGMDRIIKYEKLKAVAEEAVRAVGKPDRLSD
jgi:hypothetical protein